MVSKTRPLPQRPDLPVARRQPRRRAGRRGLQPRGPPADGRGGRPAVLPRPGDRRTTKKEAEVRLLELVDEYRADLVVLARYMQVLSDETCEALHGRAINIHHSFLPGFKGARPYQPGVRPRRQARRRDRPLRAPVSWTRARSSSRRSSASTTPTTRGPWPPWARTPRHWRCRGRSAGTANGGCSSTGTAPSSSAEPAVRTARLGGGGRRRRRPAAPGCRARRRGRVRGSRTPDPPRRSRCSSARAGNPRPTAPWSIASTNIPTAGDREPESHEGASIDQLPPAIEDRSSTSRAMFAPL